MYEFKHLSACKDTQSILRMIHLVETADSDLKCMNASEELENHVIISHIERSMSKMMLEDWAKMIVQGEKSESSQTKFQNLLVFLLYWRELLEYNDAEIRSESRKKATVDTGDVFHGEISVYSSSDCSSMQQRPKPKCLVHTCFSSCLTMPCFQAVSNAHRMGHHGLVVLRHMAILRS